LDALELAECQAGRQKAEVDYSPFDPSLYKNPEAKRPYR
jgi:hypothetical protein